MEAAIPALVPTDGLNTLTAAQRDAKIVALCDEAIDQLHEARDLEEVMAIGSYADALAAYGRKFNAAVAAQNQCHLVVLLAAARVGAELEAAQKRGEVATHSPGRPTAGKSVRAADDLPPTHADLGIPRQRAAEMKALARKGETAIRAHVKAATDAGRIPSRRSILRDIPTITERPPECTQFILWLRTGAQLLPRLGEPSSLLSTLAGHRLFPEPGQVETIVAFLSRLEPEA